MLTLEQANIMKSYVRNQMEFDVWIGINDRQRDAFKHLMLEWYGWPEFSLNFNTDLTKVMKCKL
jgi:hypothetical protein